MRTFTVLLRLFSALLVFTSLAEAWSWPGSLNDLSGLVQGHGQLLKRADESSATSETTAKASATTEAAATTGTAKATATAEASASGTDTASNTGTAGTAKTSASGSGTAAATTDASGNSTSTKTSATSTSIDARLPEGGVSMITPAATDSSSYYKIGNYVTFAWNYTSLSVTPSAIDVLASCSANDHYYTIALNQTVEPTGRVTWDTGKYQSSATIPLLTETYTLVIYDAAKDVSATAAAGYLGVYDSYTFGMYSPQPYTPLNEFKCATCSGALSVMERQAIGFVLGMGFLTVLSFTWFAGGFGVFH